MALNAELTVRLDATSLVEGFLGQISGSSGSLNAIASPADPGQLSSASGSGGSFLPAPILDAITRFAGAALPVSDVPATIARIETTLTSIEQLTTRDLGADLDRPRRTADHGAGEGQSTGHPGHDPQGHRPAQRCAGLFGAGPAAVVVRLRRSGSETARRAHRLPSGVCVHGACGRGPDGLRDRSGRRRTAHRDRRQPVQRRPGAPRRRQSSGVVSGRRSHARPGAVGGRSGRRGGDRCADCGGGEYRGAARGARRLRVGGDGLRRSDAGALQHHRGPGGSCRRRGDAPRSGSRRSAAGDRVARPAGAASRRPAGSQRRSRARHGCGAPARGRPGRTSRGGDSQPRRRRAGGAADRRHLHHHRAAARLHRPGRAARHRSACGPRTGAQRRGGAADRRSGDRHPQRAGAGDRGARVSAAPGRRHPRGARNRGRRRARRARGRRGAGRFVQGGDHRAVCGRPPVHRRPAPGSGASPRSATR